MSTLHERLEADYKTAMKAGDRRRIETIRLIKAAIQRAAIDQRKDALDDQDVIPLLANQAKQRRETLESAKKAGRQDIATQSTEELAIVESYLPQQLSPEAVKRLIEEAIQTVGSNQGQIMKHVMGKAAGAVDGKLASQLVADRLKQAA